MDVSSTQTHISQTNGQNLDSLGLCDCVKKTESHSRNCCHETTVNSISGARLDDTQCQSKKRELPNNTDSVVETKRQSTVVKVKCGQQRPKARVLPRRRNVSDSFRNKTKRKGSQEFRFRETEAQQSLSIPRNEKKNSDTLPPVKLEDKHLLKLAGGIGKGWDMLGVHLGIGQTTIEQIKFDHPGDTQQQIYKMLYQWKKKRPCATLLDLITCVREYEFVSINYDTIEALEDLAKRMH